MRPGLFSVAKVLNLTKNYIFSFILPYYDANGSAYSP